MLTAIFMSLLYIEEIKWKEMVNSLLIGLKSLRNNANENTIKCLVKYNNQAKGTNNTILMNR